MRPLRRLSALLACAAVTTLACAAGASAATFTVTSQNDADDGICDGPHCSLREAINAANRTEAARLVVRRASHRPGALRDRGTRVRLTLAYVRKR